MSDSAPGRNRIGLNDLKELPTDELLARYNLWLLTRYQLSRWRIGVTVCNLKEKGMQDPAKHQPINMSTMVFAVLTS
jgi:hypothetical protein